MVIGGALNEVVKKKTFYEKLSNFNFIRSELLNRLICLGFIKWLVYRTYWNKFNPKLKLKSKSNLNDMTLLRHEMTYAEIRHLIGFVLVMITSAILLFYKLYAFTMILSLCNIIFNLYPSLLQQYNKRRIGCLIKRQKL